MLLTLYHGSPNQTIVPTYGLGEDKHDYGRGFYLTEDIRLAREWAVCRPDESNGWIHQYTLDLTGLSVLDFSENGILAWMAELMKHRSASDSKRYRVLSARFIERFGVQSDRYDVIRGWRANASYFYIAKAFVRDEIDVDILEELLSLGDLGIQYCIKSKKAYSQLTEIKEGLEQVSFAQYNASYNERDIAARRKMKELVESDRNRVENVFSTLVQEEK